MRNQFETKCYRCGCTVEKGKGHVEKFGKRHREKHPRAPLTIKWLVQHANCAIKYRGTNKSIYSKIEP